MLALAEVAEVSQTPKNARNPELAGAQPPHDTHAGHSSSELQLCFQLPQQQFQVGKNTLSPLKLKRIKSFSTKKKSVLA